MTRLLASAAALALLVLLVAPTASSSPQQARPHAATCQGRPDDPLALEVRVTGTCHATHLGLDRFESSHTVTVLPETFDPATMTVGIRVENGVGVHEAANGDLLFSAYEGTGRASVGLPVRIEFAFDGVFTGGTGRFAGASGETRIEGVLENGIARFTEEGTITY